MNEYGRGAEVEVFDLEGSRCLRSVLENKAMDPELLSDGLADGHRKVTVTATCLAAKLRINDALY